VFCGLDAEFWVVSEAEFWGAEFLDSAFSEFSVSPLTDRFFWVSSEKGISLASCSSLSEAF
jgi:hypothetical protein